MTLLLFMLFMWALCALSASSIAEQKHAGPSGFLLGLVFGPFGLVAAGFLDQRPLCRKCGGRQNGKVNNPFPICEHCGKDNKRILPPDPNDAKWSQALEDAGRQLEAVMDPENWTGQ